jgi:hypothetical protein
VDVAARRGTAPRCRLNAGRRGDRVGHGAPGRGRARHRRVRCPAASEAAFPVTARASRVLRVRSAPSLPT